MATLPPDIDDDTDDAPEAGHTPQPINFPFSNDVVEASPLPEITERPFYGSLKEETPPPQQEGAPAEGSVETPGTGKPGSNLPRSQARMRAPMNNQLLVAPRIELNNWQDILYAHAKLNATGNPVDETGKKEINLKGMHPEFGKRLAQTFLDMDAEGHQARCISGHRTDRDEDIIRADYKNAGSSHPVGKQGWSPHVYGVATDVLPVGENHEAFYEAFHRLGKKNGLEFVTNDPNHCQIANAHEVVAQLRNEQKGPSSTQVAAATHAPSRNGAQPLA